MTDAPATPAWPDLFATLAARRDLSPEQTSWAMSEIMTGAASTPKVAAFLVGLKTKGESVAELTALADTMLAHAVRIEVPGRTLDIVGTGGDRSHTVNISTMSALVVAGAGITVVKHGNRAASSSSGSADVLESLGIRLDHSPARVAELATEVGITFCFAQVFHPSFRHTAAARTELGIGTAFNFLGPLTNPAQPRSAAIGVADARMAPLMAGVLARRGASAMVFRGEDGLDEIAPTGPTRLWEVRDGRVTESVIDWEAELGVGRVQLESLRGEKADYNADVARRLLDGEAGPVRETVVLNTAAALVADGTLPGTSGGSLVERFAAGSEHARASLDSGAAAEVLARWRAASAA
ncbi:anthranilate phosphoribosyltransferase [Cellulomonas fengjieae]|uniref:Anthranilate phosphoribosyltransferase n=1 Tax=Cellulomonas fengjieae TaxID=2819978 RepID=A0ABS3SET6_9CELL|nr:anthranilate phosphoribosyltransferase [Cellulomonas fengjieae]MBO3084167.1 anthranilate phosphoribosyltransferase [Cellulomonas fengjieae]MBO3103613.1 anthranilate phosphoribosyltransferase [Cellulomonas fengjieae]QVI64586.1 anthranilate phosphoribosyltransferase [Cellulomonas fengjieae]